MNIWKLYSKFMSDTFQRRERRQISVEFFSSLRKARNQSEYTGCTRRAWARRRRSRGKDIHLIRKGMEEKKEIQGKKWKSLLLSFPRQNLAIWRQFASPKEREKYIGPTGGKSKTGKEPLRRGVQKTYKSATFRPWETRVGSHHFFSFPDSIIGRGKAGSCNSPNSFYLRRSRQVLERWELLSFLLLGRGSSLSTALLSSYCTYNISASYKFTPGWDPHSPTQPISICLTSALWFPFRVVLLMELR